MKTVELDVSKYFDGTKQKAIIKKMSFGQIADIKDNLPMGIDKVSGIPKELEGQASLLFMQAAIVSIPILKVVDGNEKIVQVSSPTMEEVRNIDFDLGTFLVEEIFKLNGLSPN